MTTSPRLAALFLPALLTLLAACSSAEPAPASSPLKEEPIDLSPLGGDRPVEPYVPASYEPETPAPLVILLHGFGASGLLQELVFRLREVSEERGFLYLMPDGTFDPDNKRFWNATDACCNFHGADVDDVAYLRGLIEEAKERFSVDPKRVYLVGHSNGGFMAHRMACDESGAIAAVASLAGSTWLDSARCKPAEPVAVLQIHGTEDTSVPFKGEVTTEGIGYPGADETTARWAELNGCDPTPDESAAPVDFSPDVDGPETTITRYAAGCDAASRAELWTMVGERHVPGLSEGFSPAIIDFFFDHAKP
jgi:polyhydroxybutyrate depolymerase